MPRFLLSVLIGLSCTLIFAWSGTLARPYAYRHSWYPKAWRPEPYTGQTSLPLSQTPEMQKKCHDLCEATGLQLRRQVQDGQAVKIVTPGPYTRCPTSGLDYGVMNWGDFIVVCPGQAHKQPLFWDSRCGEVLNEWRTPSTMDDDARLRDHWLHAHTCYAIGDYATARAECEKIRAMGKSEGDLLAVQVHLASGQPEQALKLCDENLKNGQDDSWLQARYSCLLDLGRAKEVLEGKPGPVERCMAQLEADQDEEAARSLAELSDQALFKAYGLMALKRYDEARRECSNAIRDQGWQADYTGNAIVVGVLCDWLKGGADDDARQFLSKGLKEAPKTWPYPLLRYLNRELCEQELLEMAQPNLSHRIEARFTIGFDLLAQRSDLAHARSLLREAEPYGHFFESMTAHSLLKSL
ncbi:hypothetical protein JST97_08875 [bacterium]|nr:hypothetical protein [bacterium]